MCWSAKHKLQGKFSLYTEKGDRVEVLLSAVPILRIMDDIAIYLHSQFPRRQRTCACNGYFIVVVVAFALLWEKCVHLRLKK